MMMMMMMMMISEEMEKENENGISRRSQNHDEANSARKLGAHL